MPAVPLLPLAADLLSSASSSASPLDSERANPQFPVREMTFYLDGGESVTQIKELVAATIADDELLNDRNKFDLSRPEARERTMAKIAQVVGVIRGRAEDAAEQAAEARADGTATSAPAADVADRSASRAGAGKSFEDAFYGALGALDPSWAIRIGVHFGLFQSALMGSGTDAQIAQYARDVQEMRIIGCFAMTEMGHGSFLQGLETTATFDRDTQEFVIHTPTLTATKWSDNTHIANQDSARLTAHSTRVLSRLLVLLCSFGCVHVQVDRHGR